MYRSNIYIFTQYTYQNYIVGDKGGSSLANTAFCSGLCLSVSTNWLGQPAAGAAGPAASLAAASTPSGRVETAVDRRLAAPGLWRQAACAAPTQSRGSLGTSTG